MKNPNRRRVLFVLGLGVVASMRSGAAEPPKVGERAPAIELKTPGGTSVTLSGVVKDGPAVVLVLRGWPGYQCPLCTRQVREYLEAAEDLARAGAKVLMIYPGPAEGLGEHAAQFVGGREWPKHFRFVVDPGHRMVEAYGLRWDAPGETSYPTTLVVDREGLVRFVKVSRTHGNRTHPSEVLPLLGKPPAN